MTHAQAATGSARRPRGTTRSTAQREPAATQELAGRTAIVTGAARGIGLASARRFAAAGARLMLADVDVEAGNVACAGLAAQGHDVRFAAVDVTHEDAVEQMVAQTVAAFGGVDVVFNNAGVRGTDAPTGDLALAEFERVLRVDLVGAFLVMKHALRVMAPAGAGAIVNNASMLGLVGYRNQAAYTAAKGGVVQLTRTAALEYAARGIRINCVCPGFVEGGLADPSREKDLAALAQVTVPMARLGTVDEIADAVLFLASDRASFLTGAILAADGGYVAR